MNLLDAIPEIGKILDDLISTPEEKREAQLRLREIDVREVEARFGALRAWQSHRSLFVSGAIPAILWMIVGVAVFNYILVPLLGSFGVSVPVLELPGAYYSLAETITLGLFGKKAWDSSEIHWGGQVVKPAKEKVAAEIEEPKAAKSSRPRPAPRKAAEPHAAKQKEGEREEGSAPKPTSEMTSEEVDDRLRQICEERGIEW